MALSHRCIKLTARFTRDFVVGVHDCFRVRVDASDSHEMPDAVFAYRQQPLEPGAARKESVFDHVCSPVDLADYPLGAPRTNDIPPWFRLGFVEYDSPTREEALEDYNAIVADVVALVRSLDNAEIMVEQPPVWIGYHPGSDGSSVGSSDGSFT